MGSVLAALPLSEERRGIRVVAVDEQNQIKAGAGISAWPCQPRKAEAEGELNQQTTAVGTRSDGSHEAAVTSAVTSAMNAS